MIERFVDSIVVPEPRIGKVPVSFSAAAIIEANDRLLLVQEKDGYGPPAGRMNDYEWLHPKSGLFWEIQEEIPNITSSFDMSLCGVMISPTKKELSVGLAYRVNDFSYDDEMSWGTATDDDVIGHEFFSRDEIKEMLDKGRVRKEKWNRPLLQAWIDERRMFITCV